MIVYYFVENIVIWRDMQRHYLWTNLYIHEILEVMYFSLYATVSDNALYTSTSFCCATRLSFTRFADIVIIVSLKVNYAILCVIWRIDTYSSTLVLNEKISKCVVWIVIVTYNE